ncbi:MAG: hypothetical protein AAB911_01955 [Patescibacteria group bacterium]
MRYPVIKFIFDQKLDRDLAWEFYSRPKFGGCDFWKERALAHHPKLSRVGSAKNPKEFLNKYISEFYSSHSDEMKKLSQKTANYLNQTQNDFFKIIDKIFDYHPWPRNKFTGCFSIFDFCPRFLDWGGFQVFIYDKPNLQLFTIFHELLHFIFYDFTQQEFPEVFGKMETEQGKFWDLAEVFNVVIQSSDDFVKLHGKIKNIGYPDHKGLIQKGKGLWKKNPDLNQWIIGMMEVV